jgi:hypothetical protein
MPELSPPNCEDPAVVEAHRELYKLFLTEDAPVPARDGPTKIYHAFFDWAERNGYDFPRDALLDQEMRGIRCMEEDVAAAVLTWLEDEQPGEMWSERSDG